MPDLDADTVGSTLDYLGRAQPLTRPRLSLTASAGGGPVTAPLTPAPFGPTAGTMTPAGSEGGVPAGVGGDRALTLAQQILGLGRTGAGLASKMMSPSGLPFADPQATEAGQVTPTSGQTGAVGGPVGGSEGLEGAASVPGTQRPETFTGSAVLDTASGALALASGIAQDDPIGAARGATSLAGTAGRAVGGATGEAVGTVAPYVGAALNIIQDAISGTKPVSQQALNAAIEVAAAALAGPTFGASLAAAPLVKQDIATTLPVLGHFGEATTGQKIQALNPDVMGRISDAVVGVFGGPSLESLIFGGGASKSWQSFPGRVAGDMTQTAQHLQSGYQKIAAAQSPEELSSAIDAYNQSVGFPGSLGRPTQVGNYTLMDVSGRDWPGGKIHGRNFPSTQGGFSTAFKALTQLIQQKSAEFEQKSAVQALLDQARALGPRASALMPAGPAGALGFSSDVLQGA